MVGAILISFISDADLPFDSLEIKHGFVEPRVPTSPENTLRRVDVETQVKLSRVKPTRASH